MVVVCAQPSRLNNAEFTEIPSNWLCIDKRANLYGDNNAR